jgi:hypothetical protein
MWEIYGNPVDRDRRPALGLRLAEVLAAARLNGLALVWFGLVWFGLVWFGLVG